MHLRSLVLGSLFLGLAVPAFAATVTYDVTFTPTMGVATGGSGTFTTDSVNGGLLSLDVTVDGHHFGLGDQISVTPTVNADGSGLTYEGWDSDSYFLYIPEGPGYRLDFYASGNVGYGTLNVVNPAATSATPEPSSFALLGSGAVGVVGVLRRRRATR